MVSNRKQDLIKNTKELLRQTESKFEYFNLKIDMLEKENKKLKEQIEGKNMNKRKKEIL